MPRLLKSVGHEIKELLPVWLFFFVVFSLLRLTQAVIIRQYGIHSSTPSLVLIGSLIVAKTFLVIDLFSFVERFREKPLIYDVLWKTGIYFIGTYAMYFLEQLVELSIKHGSLSLAWTQVTAEVGTPHFFLIQGWLALLLFAYTAVRETAHAMGKERFMSLWFGQKRSRVASSATQDRKAA